MNTERTLPRRRLLAGVFALPAVAVAAAMPALASAEPDAELLELGRQHQAATAHCNALWEQADAAFQIEMASFPPTPEALRIRLGDHPISNVDLGARRVGEIMDSRDLGRWRANADMHWVLSSSSRQERLARRAEILAAWDGWAEAKERAASVSGRRAIEAKADAAGQAVTDLERRIFDLRATTPAGLRIKARIAREILGDETDGTYEDHLVRSILADLTEQGAA